MSYANLTRKDAKRCTSDDEMLITEDFFEEQKKKVFIELPFCPKNEKLSKTFEKFLEKTVSTSSSNGKRRR